jgi:hypothetical protein
MRFVSAYDYGVLSALEQRRLPADDADTHAQEGGRDKNKSGADPSIGARLSQRAMGLADKSA